MRSQVVNFVTLVYRLFFSPALHLFFGPSLGCRFTPTCSQYASEAIDHHGFIKGGILTIRRISRCHPFSQAGHDPVPHVIASSRINSTGVSGR